MTKKIFLIFVILVLLVFFAGSFSQAARYTLSDKVRGGVLACLKKTIYESDDKAEALIFGSSRMKFAFSSLDASRVATNILGEPVLFQSVGLAGPNYTVSLQLLREYLDNRPAPKIMYVEVPRLKSVKTEISYLNPATPAVANWKFHHNFFKIFKSEMNTITALSATKNILIQKIDLNISHSIVRRNRQTRKKDRTCNFVRTSSLEKFTKRNNKQVQKQTNKRDPANALTRLMRIELGKLRKVQSEEQAAAYRQEHHRPLFQFSRAVYLQEYAESWENGRAPAWSFETSHGKFQIAYARELVDFARKNNIEIVFIRPYSMFDNEIPSEQLTKYSELVGADTIAMPYDLVKLSFLYYKDGAHPGPKTQRAQSIWLVDDFNKRRNNFARD